MKNIFQRIIFIGLMSAFVSCATNIKDSKSEKQVSEDTKQSMVHEHDIPDFAIDL